MLLDQVRKKFEDAGYRVSPRDDVDEAAVAWFLSLKPKTLRNWRVQKTGPRYVKLACGVRYEIESLLDYLREKLAA